MQTPDELFADETEVATLRGFYFEATGREISTIELRALFDELPEDIQEEACEWGLDDLAFVDEAIEFLTRSIVRAA